MTKLHFYNNAEHVPAIIYEKQKKKKKKNVAYSRRFLDTSLDFVSISFHSFMSNSIVVICLNIYRIFNFIFC